MGLLFVACCRPERSWAVSCGSPPDGWSRPTAPSGAPAGTPIGWRRSWPRAEPWSSSDGGSRAVAVETFAKLVELHESLPGVGVLAGALEALAISTRRLPDLPEHVRAVDARVDLIGERLDR